VKKFQNHLLLMWDINTSLGLVFFAFLSKEKEKEKEGEKKKKKEREERKKTRKDVPGGYECCNVPADWIEQHLGKRDEANETLMFESSA